MWGSGYCFVNSSISLRIVDSFAASPRESTAASNQAATFFISASLRPRVVRAGVPTRMPLVSMALRVSKGTMFLLTMMPADWSQPSTAAPVRLASFAAEVDEHEVVVGAAGDEAVAAAA